MTRRRRAGRSRDGLWNWTPDGDTAPAEVRDNPCARPCTWCHAQPGEPCTTRLSRGRSMPVPNYHHARKQPAEEAR